MMRLHAAKKTFPPEQVLQVANQLCEALQYAHDLQIIHRDVNP